MAYFRVNPFAEFEKVTKDMEDFFQKNLEGGNRPRVTIGDFSPRVDIIDDKNILIFQAEVPGVAKENIKVSVSDENVLTIKGEKKFDKENIKTCCKSERQYGQFTRSFQLPDLLDTDKIEAKYDNGVLSLNIPKLEPVKPKEKDITIS
jgi:HSP20 family protein